MKRKISRFRIPIWFLVIFVTLIVITIIESLYVIKIFSLDVLGIIFYLLEMIVIGYVFYRLLKRFDRIHIGTDMSLFGLRILSGIISVIGAYFLIMFLIFGLPILLSDLSSNLESMQWMYNIFGIGPLFSIFTFGIRFGLPYTGLILYISITLGMVLIGGYLFFKFQRRTGRFIWVGKI